MINRQFMLAVKLGNIATIKSLLDGGEVDIEYKENKSAMLEYNALDLASCYGLIEVAKVLIEYGAKITFSNLFNAIDNNEEDVVKLFIEHGASKEEALLLAAYQEHIDLVKFLLEKKADINHVNTNGDTPLMRAIQSVRFTGKTSDTVKLLISNENTNFSLKNKEGKTARDLAFAYKLVDTVALIDRAQQYKKEKTLYRDQIKMFTLGLDNLSTAIGTNDNIRFEKNDTRPLRLFRAMKTFDGQVKPLIASFLRPKKPY